MSDQTAAPGARAFYMPSNMHEFVALLLSVGVVFVLIQVGAPLIREAEFLDPKLRDYFIGISFVAFPGIHRGCKRGLAAFAPHTAPKSDDLAPWFVTGVIAAALLFSWNQFVSFLGGVSSGLTLGQLGAGLNADQETLTNAVMIGILVVSLPLSAVAAVFAGISLNRYTPSHTFSALALCAVSFVVFNAGTNWLFQPEFVEAQIKTAVESGPNGVALFVLGLALVGIIIFVFGAVGVFISRFNRERSIGRLITAARRMSADERDALTAEIARREAQARAASAATGAEP